MLLLLLRRRRLRIVRLLSNLRTRLLNRSPLPRSLRPLAPTVPTNTRRPLTHQLPTRHPLNPLIPPPLPRRRKLHFRRERRPPRRPTRRRGYDGRRESDLVPGCVPSRIFRGRTRGGRGGPASASGDAARGDFVLEGTGGGERGVEGGRGRRGVAGGRGAEGRGVGWDSAWAVGGLSAGLLEGEALR